MRFYQVAIYAIVSIASFLLHPFIATGESMDEYSRICTLDYEQRISYLRRVDSSAFENKHGAVWYGSADGPVFWGVINGDMAYSGGVVMMFGNHFMNHSLSPISRFYLACFIDNKTYLKWIDGDLDWESVFANCPKSGRIYVIRDMQSGDHIIAANIPPLKKGRYYIAVTFESKCVNDPTRKKSIWKRSSKERDKFFINICDPRIGEGKLSLTGLGSVIPPGYEYRSMKERSVIPLLDAGSVSEGRHLSLPVLTFYIMSVIASLILGMVVGKYVGSKNI